MEPSSAGISIDWRLLLLQAANFLFLLGILTWLVWKPLIKSIDDRRTAIAEGLAAAEAQRAAAEAAERENLKRLAESKAEAAALVAQTRAELAGEREALKHELTKERERLRHETERELTLKRSKLTAEVRAATAKLVVQALSRILGDEKESTDRWTKVAAAALKDLE